MSLFADEYMVYVFAAYLATAVIVIALIWASVVASRRARRELDGLEQTHSRHQRHQRR